MQVLQSRAISKGQRLVQQVWSGLPDELATWEDQEALRQRFPLNLKKQQGEEGVSVGQM